MLQHNFLMMLESGKLINLRHELPLKADFSIIVILIGNFIIEKCYVIHKSRTSYKIYTFRNIYTFCSVQIIKWNWSNRSYSIINKYWLKYWCILIPVLWTSHFSRTINEQSFSILFQYPSKIFSTINATTIFFCSKQTFMWNITIYNWNYI